MIIVDTYLHAPNLRNGRYTDGRERIINKPLPEFNSAHQPLFRASSSFLIPFLTPHHSTSRSLTPYPLRAIPFIISNSLALQLDPSSKYTSTPGTRMGFLFRSPSRFLDEIQWYPQTDSASANNSFIAYT